VLTWEKTKRKAVEMRAECLIAKAVPLRAVKTRKMGTECGIKYILMNKPGLKNSPQPLERAPHGEYRERNHQIKKPG